MKPLKLYLLIAFTFLFTGCFEVHEEIVLNKNGSGTLSMKTDMSKLMEMLSSFMPEEELKKSEFAGAKDTTMYMKDMMDNAQDMTPEKKALLQDGSIHLKMNMTEKVFNLDMAFPFKKPDDIGKIYETLGETGGGMGQLLKGMGNQAGTMGDAAPDIKSSTSFYDIHASKGSLSRTLNKEKFALVMKDSMMQQMRQMGGMSGGMDEIKMTTTVKLPKKAKKVTGAKAELSSDKKTVMVKANLMDMYAHPEQYEFSVKY